MLTMLLFVIYFTKYKSVENIIIHGHKENNLANIFFVSNGKAKNQLSGNLIINNISDKILFIGCVIIDIIVIASAALLIQ